MKFRSRRQRDDDLDEQLRGHLSMAIEERVARGESYADAERAARREFGNLGVVSEVTREMWGGAWFERLKQDVHYGARTLRRSPAFSLVAGLTLALGIGATTAMFTIVHAVLLRPLPYPQSERLVQVSYQNPKSPYGGPGMADVDWIAIRDKLRLFDRAAAYGPALVTLTHAGDPVRIAGGFATSELFEALGVPAARGRTLARADEAPGSERVVVLGDRLWRERFSADPGIVGKPITLEGVPRTVVGIMPPRFNFPNDAQLWLPLELHPTPSFSQLVAVLGRLRAGVTTDQASAEVASIAGASANANPSEPRRDRRWAPVISLKSAVVQKAERSLFVFAGAVGLVLLIACANVANLLLMRATSRHREMAVRAALGAGRRRLVRQLVTESALLWMAAGAAGVGIAFVGVRALLALAPPGRIPRQDEIGIDATALAFALTASLVTGVIFGLIPAIRATRGGVRDALAATSRTMTGRDGRLRGVLVVAEIALALVLLAGAGLMVQSFVRMRSLELGFQPAKVAALTVDLPEASYQSVAAMQEFHRAMLERLSRAPGAVSAAAVNFVPLGTALIRGDFTLPEGRKRPPGFTVAKPSVSPGYFRTMGIRLLAGREFTAADAADAPRVVIVSRSVAERIWPGQNAVGQLVSMSDKPGPGDWISIVGVVEDVAQETLDGHRDVSMYSPYAQQKHPFFVQHMTYVVRAENDARDLFPAMRQALREVDRMQPIGSMITMDGSIAATVADPLFHARLIGVFSVFALLLAGIGIYGVVAYSVAERTHEIGIRVALGAARGDVMQMVLGRVGALVIPGVVIGVVGALATTRVLSTLLFDIEPNDPVTFAGVAALLVVVAIVAGVVPARRASRVDPLVALRVDG
jgi:predicted permease